MGTGKGAGIGALVGGIVGVLGGPVGVALGAGVGAAVGAAASGDKGFRNESLGTVGVALKPGTSAIAAITSHDFLRAVQKQVPIEQTRAAVSNLAAELSARLGENKNVAIGLLLTENGLAIKEIAANEETAEVMGAVITDDATIVGAAVATADGVAYQIVGATEGGRGGRSRRDHGRRRRYRRCRRPCGSSRTSTQRRRLRQPMPRSNRQRRLRRRHAEEAKA